MEALWDPGSKALFVELGISKGWKCLEVGAGGGSLVEWMAAQGASVLAVDIDTRFVEPLASDSIEVRRIDVRTDELPQAEFDLVHSRLVLEHLTDRADSPRVVVLSAKTAARDVIRALSLGAADYLTKPFDPDGLISTVSRVLASSDADLDEHRRAVIGRLDGEGQA